MGLHIAFFDGLVFRLAVVVGVCLVFAFLFVYAFVVNLPILGHIKNSFLVVYTCIRRWTYTSGCLVLCFLALRVLL